MDYVYPAVFHKNEDNSYTIYYPDLPGCISEGKTLGNALYMAQSALTEWLKYLTDKKHALPQTSESSRIHVQDGEFINLVLAEIQDERELDKTSA